MPLSLPTDPRTPADSPTIGTLFVLATPIGNMEDITLRALRTLNEVALVAAEDTRHTRKLLSRHQISVSLTSYHDFNKEKRTPGIIGKLKSGKSVALVTDAGTPGISDPGYYLVRAAIDSGIDVVPIPGPSALVAALSVSGLPTDSFLFIGFVPRKPAKRKQLLKDLKKETQTLIFYESPKRLLSLIKSLVDIMGDRDAVVARELTKIHEEILRGPLSTIFETLSGRSSLKGECSLLVHGNMESGDTDRGRLQDELRRLSREEGRSLSDLVREVAERRRLPRKLVYEEALKIKKEKGWNAG
jgi:16S rRNA (cytidine1402-2'-O)-methyltransferase